MIVVSISLVLCCIVYTLTGTFGYLTFGTNVDSDILVSYGANDPLVIAARIGCQLILFKNKNNFKTLKKKSKISKT